MITYLKNMEDYKRDLVEGSSKRAGEELEQESTKKQKVDEDKDTAELQSLMEVIPNEEEVAIDVVPLATKSPNYSVEVNAASENMLEVTTASEYQVNVAS
ncbi:hypothetical protein Tco_0964079 [Tanacetum coccineum]